MALDTNGKWVNIAIWATMLTTRFSAQVIFSRTGFTFHFNDSFTLFPLHAALYALTRIFGTPIFDARKPNRDNLATTTELLIMFAGGFIYVTLLKSWSDFDPNVATVVWSIVFLGLLSVYFLCLSRIICPGVKTFIPVVPLVVSAAPCSFHVIGVALWFPMMFGVIGTQVFLEKSDREFSEKAAAEVAAVHEADIEVGKKEAVSLQVGNNETVTITN